MRKILILLVTVLTLIGNAQDEKKFGIKFSGFVKTDIFFDSRQTWDARDGQFLLYPKNEFLDENGDDINAVSKFNMLSIQTRLKGAITGPDALGAKTSGLIEGAFFWKYRLGLERIQVAARLCEIGLGKNPIAGWPVLAPDVCYSLFSRNGFI